MELEKLNLVELNVQEIKVVEGGTLMYLLGFILGYGSSTYGGGDIDIRGCKI